MDILKELESWNLKTCAFIADRAVERAKTLTADGTLGTNLTDTLAALAVARSRIDTLDAG